MKKAKEKAPPRFGLALCLSLSLNQSQINNRVLFGG